MAGRQSKHEFEENLEGNVSVQIEAALWDYTREKMKP
jgi:hypothetical protein